MADERRDDPNGTVRYPKWREDGALIVPGRSREPEDLVFVPNPDSPNKSILTAKVRIQRTRAGYRPILKAK
jgi:hypothetical protein